MAPAAEMGWRCLPFAELGVEALYALMRLRQEVFVVEQACAYLDADGADPACWHVMGWQAAAPDRPEAMLQACLRIKPPGLSYPEASIGRVVTAPAMRGTGLGLELVAQGLRHCDRLYPADGIQISAQAHLQRFYERFGFVAFGETYLEDDIPHIAMIRAARVGRG